MGDSLFQLSFYRETYLRKGHNNRVICGDVLSGTKINRDGYLGFYDTQITVIKEGDQEEFLGWILPGFDKFSLSDAKDA